MDSETKALLAGLDAVTTALSKPKRTREEAREAQSKYAREHDCPNFAPYSLICSCGCDLFARYGYHRCATELITGCPGCNRSYCD